MVRPRIRGSPASDGTSSQDRLAGLYWSYVGIMEKEMEATTVYWGYIGIADRKWKLLQSFIFGYSLRILQPPPPDYCIHYVESICYYGGGGLLMKGRVLMIEFFDPLHRKCLSASMFQWLQP